MYSCVQVVQQLLNCAYNTVITWLRVMTSLRNKDKWRNGKFLYCLLAHLSYQAVSHTVWKLGFLAHMMPLWCKQTWMYACNLVPLGVPGIWQFTLAQHESKLLQDYLYYSKLTLLSHDSSNDTELKYGSLACTCTWHVIYYISLILSFASNWASI